MNIKNIILVIIIIYLIIKVNIKKENFTLTNDDETRIRTIIKDIYSTDLDAVRTLATMAKKIQDGGFTVNGDLNVTGKVTINSSLLSKGDIKSESDIITKNNSISNLQSSISNLVSSINQTNLALPVFINLNRGDVNTNSNHHTWVLSSDSEFIFTWGGTNGGGDGNIINIKSRLATRANTLGYSLPHLRVQTYVHNWDFRSGYTSYFISVPNGKACRLFGWHYGEDKYYGEGTHYISGVSFSGGLHGIWAGIASRAYELIPANYSVSDLTRI